MRRDQFLKTALLGGCGMASCGTQGWAERVVELDAAALLQGMEATRVLLQEGAATLDSRKWRPDAAGLIVSDVIDLAGEDTLGGPALVRQLQVSARSSPGVDIAVRTGSTYFQRPGSWSDWSAAAGAVDPAGRYAQLRLRLTGGEAKTATAVRGVTLRCQVRQQRVSGTVRMVSSDIERIVRSPVEFGYESPGQSDVAWMRDVFGLDKVIAGKATELDRVSALMHWVAARPNIRPGPWEAKREPFPWNIRRVMTTENGGTIYSHCMSYCEAMVTAATALGWHARHWALTGVRDTCHEVPEVWIDELRKWVFFDPSLDTYYADRQSGVPLNLLEMHNRYLGAVLRPDEKLERGRHVHEDRLKALRGKHPVKCVTGNVCYGKPCRWDWEWDHGYMTAGWMQLTPRNDWHSRPEPRFDHFGDGAEGYGDFPLYIDRQTPLTADVTRWMTRERDLWWTLNQASLRLTRGGDGVLDVEFGQSQPHFRTYLCRRDGGAWTAAGPSLQWKLKPGANRLEVVPENVSGRRGLASSVVVEYQAG